MYKTLIEDIFSDPEEVEETTFPATDKDLLILTEKFLGFEIPSKVFLQAIAIADYDGAGAFRYVDNYLTTLKNTLASSNSHVADAPLSLLRALCTTGKSCH